jgi:hopanoid biosynthesis associated protein HpnK
MRGSVGSRDQSSALASSERKTQDAKTARLLKQLILTADDFGRTPEINAAIERAHRAGFLTQASLMVNEDAVEDAVRIAQRNPGLGVGLHLTLCAGHASQPSPLTDRTGQFPSSPAWSGIRYFVAPSLTEPLRAEIRRQFERFLGLGFAPSYWDGHTHLHLHPTILRLTAPIAAELGFRSVRLVRESGPPALLPWIFQRLSASALPQLKPHGIRFADRVFGLRHTGRMDTSTMARILQELPDGISEIYFHPGEEPVEIDYPTLTRMISENQIVLKSSANAGNSMQSDRV